MPLPCFKTYANFLLLLRHQPLLALLASHFISCSKCHLFWEVLPGSLSTLFSQHLPHCVRARIPVSPARLWTPWLQESSLIYIPIPTRNSRNSRSPSTFASLDVNFSARKSWILVCHCKFMATIKGMETGGKNYIYHLDD